MKENFLKKLYRDYLLWNLEQFLKDAPLWYERKKFSFSKEKLIEIYENFEKETYVTFLKKIKDLIFSKNIFDFLLLNSTEFWDLEILAKFLEKKEIIKVKKNGKVEIKNEKILSFFLPPQKSKICQKEIQKKLQRKIDKFSSFSPLFGMKIKPCFDQLPLSFSSIVFLCEKIFEYLPLYEKILFVGDDDFLSLALCLCQKKIKATVIDIDNSLLKKIEKIAKKYSLLIETKKVDVEKKKALKEKYHLVVLNPPYNLWGAQKFLNFAKKQIGKEGGFIFLIIGDESMGNRFLLLQEFLTRKKMIVKEVIQGKIFYPWEIFTKEDRVLKKRALSLVKKEVLNKSPKLTASLWILEVLPHPVKKIKEEKYIYGYI